MSLIRNLPHIIKHRPKCSIYGCPFIGAFYFGEVEEPEDKNEMKIYEDNCVFCNGKGCGCCDYLGKASFYEYTGKTYKWEYWECPFHYGIFYSFIELFKNLVSEVKGWIA